jgi:hypothetical protein
MSVNVWSAPEYTQFARVFFANSEFWMFLTLENIFDEIVKKYNDR